MTIVLSIYPGKVTIYLKSWTPKGIMPIINYFDVLASVELYFYFEKRYLMWFWSIILWIKGGTKAN